MLLKKIIFTVIYFHTPLIRSEKMLPLKLLFLHLPKKKYTILYFLLIFSLFYQIVVKNIIFPMYPMYMTAL